MTSVERSAFRRGDLVLFRLASSLEFISRDPSSRELLVGIVQVIRPHTTTTRHGRLTYKSVLTVFIVGKCCPDVSYPDHIMEPLNTKNNKSKELSLRLKQFRKEVASQRIQAMKAEGHENFDCAETLCSYVNCLDDIIIGSRGLVVGHSPLAKKKMDLLVAANLIRPSSFRQSLKQNLNLLEARNREVLLYIKIRAIRFWGKTSKELSQRRLNSAAVTIQKFVRGTTVRKEMLKNINKFEKYYAVPGSHKHCYSTGTSKYLSTQAKANEWFCSLSTCANIMVRFLLTASRVKMSLAMNRWRGVINLQKVELERMAEEEIFSII